MVTPAVPAEARRLGTEGAALGTVIVLPMDEDTVGSCAPSLLQLLRVGFFGEENTAVSLANHCPIQRIMIYTADSTGIGSDGAESFAVVNIERTAWAIRYCVSHVRTLNVTRNLINGSPTRSRTVNGR